MVTLDNYFVLNGLVIATLSAILLLCSWIFTSYAVPVTTVETKRITFSQIAQVIGVGAGLVFASTILNFFYPLTFFKIIVPSFLCAAVVHSIIIVFSLHLRHHQQVLLKFPKFFALCLNYTFFSIIAFVVIYYNNPLVGVFFYYLTEAGVKVGVMTLLYLLLKLKVCHVSEVHVERDIIYNDSAPMFHKRDIEFDDK